MGYRSENVSLLFCLLIISAGRVDPSSVEKFHDMYSIHEEGMLLYVSKYVQDKLL